MTVFGNDETQAGVAVAALDRGPAIDAWSLALTLAALGGILWGSDVRSAWSTGCLAVCVGGGLAQRYYAARVAFDAALFRVWAGRTDVAPNEAPHDGALAATPHDGALAATDRALAALRLRKNDQPTRDLANRSRGALRLLGWQALCLSLQFAALLAVLVR